MIENVRSPIWAWSRLGLIATFSLGAGIWLLGEMLGAKWSVYGDHEMLVFLGADGRTRVSDIWPTLMQTEVGIPGETTRFRPTTYFMYIFEGALWGRDPALWQAARLGVFVTAVSAFAWGLTRVFGLVLSLSLCALLLTAPYWGSVWISIGPNEQYLALFAVPFCITYARLHGWPLQGAGLNADKPVSWAICMASAAFLIGVKENMVMLVAPLAWLTWLSFRKNPKLDYRALLIVLVVSWALFIAGAIIIGLSRVGSDFYGATVNPFTRLLELLRVNAHWPLNAMFSLLGALVATHVTLRHARFKNALNPELIARIRMAMILQGVLFVAALAHAFFYNGWITQSRYAFPGDVFAFLSGALALDLLLTIIAGGSPHRRRVAELAAAIVVTSSALWIGYRPIRSQAKAYRVASVLFSAQMANVISHAKASPRTPIVLESSTPYDLEPVFSVDRQLVLNGVENPIFLRLHALDRANFPQEPFFYSMIRTLEGISETGKIDPMRAAGTLPSPFLVKFSPIDELSSSEPCFGVQLASAPESSCKVLATIAY